MLHFLLSPGRQLIKHIFSCEELKNATIQRNWEHLDIPQWSMFLKLSHFILNTASHKLGYKAFHRESKGCLFFSPFPPIFSPVLTSAKLFSDAWLLGVVLETGEKAAFFLWNPGQPKSCGGLWHRSIPISRFIELILRSIISQLGCERVICTHKESPLPTSKAPTSSFSSPCTLHPISTSVTVTSEIWTPYRTLIVTLIDYMDNHRFRDSIVRPVDTMLKLQCRI